MCLIDGFLVSSLLYIKITAGILEVKMGHLFSILRNNLKGVVMVDLLLPSLFLVFYVFNKYLVVRNNSKESEYREMKNAEGVQS